MSVNKKEGVHRLALDLKHRIGQRHSVTVHSEIRQVTKSHMNAQKDGSMLHLRVVSVGFCEDPSA